ncbi:MAG: CHAT domain-containing protein [Deltaproteobacteria bacterium]|nr:CHAT domain-containing protein [Deltaproteobacteria bacterium]
MEIRINEAKALLGLSDALFEEGRYHEAESSYKNSLDLSEQMNTLETKWRAIYGLARIKLSSDPQKAEELLRKAVDVIEKMRSEIKIEQLKESFTDNKLSVYEALIKLLADKGKIAESFEIAERSRSRNFIDLLGNSPLTLNREIDQALYEKQKLMRQRIEETESLLSQSGESAERKTYQKRLIELNHEYQNLLLQIQAENPQLSSMISVIPLEAKQLLKHLEPDTALISFYMLEAEIFCWIIRKDNNRMESASEIMLIRIDADRKIFGRDILEYRRMIQNLEPVEELSKKLYSLLIKKTIPHLEGVKNIGIIPHGALHYLSFSTLYSGKIFLAEDFSIFYLPSASVWKYTKSRRQAKKNTNVLAIGNPDLGDPVFDLPFSEHEVDSIRWNFPNITVLTKERASEEWVVKNIGKFGIIHLASHGEFNPVNPLFSAIKLSKTGEYDGNLETSEVFGLQINADMVVLSACQTGLGKVTGGDDVIGLNRAFFYAGTHTVVSSLWRVSDVSTALLVKEFYRKYKTGNKADSLKYAILHVKNRYPHPGYWGAFTLVGDYE